MIFGASIAAAPLAVAQPAAGTAAPAATAPVAAAPVAPPPTDAVASKAVAPTPTPPVASGTPAPTPPVASETPPPTPPVASGTPAPTPPVASEMPAPTPPVASETPVRFDVIAMVLHADIVVQAVMAFLVLCSITTWTILIEKTFLLGRARRLSVAFLRTFRSARTVGDFAEKINGSADSPVSRMWQAAKQEWDLFQTAHADRRITVHQADGLVQRMAVAATIAQESEMLQMSKSMGILATIGSTAPFIGLFGTVWGILTSFVGIAASKATSLSAVAPGIAEALLATAIGLVAAIPAVMIYNKFARQLSQVGAMLDNFQGELATVVSRELEVVG
jgi:TolQ protein